MIHIIRDHATPEQMKEMLEVLETYVKIAVDIDRGILAGGGAMHADCEALLVEDGSQQEFIWGADWNPSSRQVTFELLINIRRVRTTDRWKYLIPISAIRLRRSRQSC